MTFNEKLAVLIEEHKIVCKYAHDTMIPSELVTVEGDVFKKVTEWWEVLLVVRELYYGELRELVKTFTIFTPENKECLLYDNEWN